MAAAIKKLIHEEFGDGIMSDINFSRDIVREADPKGGSHQRGVAWKSLPNEQHYTESIDVC
jgi:cyanate lyase